MASGKNSGVVVDSVGIECGGTRTTVVGVSKQGRVIQRHEYSTGNLQLLTDSQLQQLFKDIALSFGSPRCLGIGMAGLRGPLDRRRVRAALGSVWPETRTYITNDLETILAAIPEPEGHSYSRVLLVAGTGSCCLGRCSDGVEVKVGGWGHHLGDQLGAYGIGIEAIRELVRDLDRTGKMSSLLRRVVASLGLKHADDLIGWSAKATKSEIGALAPFIFSAWKRGHPIGKKTIEGVVEGWIEDAGTCLKRIGGGATVQFILSGGCFSRQAKFAGLVAAGLQQRYPQCQMVRAGEVGAEGAADLGKRLGKRSSVASKGASLPSNEIVPKSVRMSPTEQRNPRSRQLDSLSIRKAIELMIREDATLPKAILEEASEIERVVRWVARSLTSGGRLFYFGAGTSGRLGVLDASECPPTFRTERHLVQGIIAGGRTALWESIEGAEDSVELGAAEVRRLKVTSADVVVGIAASGRTPFVWGSLVAAKALKAKTVLVCFNPHLEFARGTKPDALICPKIGPEILTGSTRLKSGTATKMILNMITTLAMVRLGKVIQNLMIDLNPSNEKLRDRAVRIIVELTGCANEVALNALEAEAWVVKKAFQRAQSSARKEGTRS
jgi:N-acetylmuramic acid 6-phosphate etherase